MSDANNAKAQLKTIKPDQKTLYQPATFENKKTKKHNGLFVIGCIIIFFVVLDPFVELFINERADYISGLKEESIDGATMSFEEMIEYSIDSPKWHEREEKDGTIYVDISGTLKSEIRKAIHTKKVVLSMRVEPTDESKGFSYIPEKVSLDGVEGDTEAANEFLSVLLLAAAYDIETSGPNSVLIAILFLIAGPIVGIIIVNAAYRLFMNAFGLSSMLVNTKIMVIASLLTGWVVVYLVLQWFGAVPHG